MRRTLAIIGALLLSAVPALAQAATQISVTGTGTVALMPDEATVNASITTLDPNAENASSRNNAAYEEAVRAVTARGIARSDITLSYYNISYQPKPPEVQPNEVRAPANYGYTVTRSFAVKVRAIAKAGAIVDALTPTPGIEVGGVTFGLNDPSSARRDATGKAVSDARAKAQAVAAAAGVRITGISRIDLEGGYAPGPMPVMRMATEAAKVPTVFDSSSVNVTVSVTMVFSASP